MTNGVLTRPPEGSQDPVVNHYKCDQSPNVSPDRPFTALTYEGQMVID